MRLELARHEWARFKANDSLECQNCHNYEYMDFTRQSVRAQNMQSTYLANKEKSCIDCHRGIAHRLPHIPPGEAPTDTPGHEASRKCSSDRQRGAYFVVCGSPRVRATVWVEFRAACTRCRKKRCAYFATRHTGSDPVFGLNLGRDHPRKKVGDAIDWMVGDALEHLAQVCFRIDAVELCGSDQTVEFFGVLRIQGAFANLSHKVGRGTIANVLKRNGIEPSPERSGRTPRSTFLKAHLKVLAAGDFLTVEVWTGRDLITQSSGSESVHCD